MSQEKPMKLDPDGKPFTKEKDAEALLKSEELNPEIWGVMKHLGGYAVATYRTIAAETARLAAEAAKPKTGAHKETYTRIVCNQKQGENDLPYVPVSKNNFQLRLQRGKEVIIPDSFRKILDNAAHTAWIPSDDPDQPMQEDGIIQRYQYRIVGTAGKATAADYKKMLKSGNLITKQAIEVKKSRR